VTELCAPLVKSVDIFMFIMQLRSWHLILPRSPCFIGVAFLTVLLANVNLSCSKLQYGILSNRSPSIKVLNTTGIRFGKKWPHELIPVALDEKLGEF